VLGVGRLRKLEAGVAGGVAEDQVDLEPAVDEQDEADDPWKTPIVSVARRSMLED
jgi:hypothetical protein